MQSYNTKHVIAGASYKDKIIDCENIVKVVLLVNQQASNIISDTSYLVQDWKLSHKW